MSRIWKFGIYRRRSIPKSFDTLVAIYKHHITVEDNFVFPLAARLLSSTDKADIADEMAARRS